MYVAFRHVARQIWLRWPNDQPLVSPYNAGVVSIKPVMRITAITNWKILWPTNLILMSREMKDSEERINSLKTILKLVKDRKSVKIMYIPLQGSKTICSQILLALGKSWFTSTCIFLFSWRMTCPLSKWEWIETSLGQLDSTYFKPCCSHNGRRHLKNMAITLSSMDGFATHLNQHIHVNHLW